MLIKNFVLYFLLFGSINILFAPKRGIPDDESGQQWDPLSEVQEFDGQFTLDELANSENWFIPLTTSLEDCSSQKNCITPVIVHERTALKTPLLPDFAYPQCEYIQQFEGQEKQQQDLEETTAVESNSSVFHLITPAAVNTEDTIQIFPDKFPSLLHVFGFTEILQHIFIKNPDHWDRQKMSMLLSQRFLSTQKANSSLIILLKAVLYNDFDLFKEEFEKSNYFFRCRIKYSLIYISLLVLPLLARSKAEFIDFLNLLKRTLKFYSGVRDYQQFFCLTFINILLQTSGNVTLSSFSPLLTNNLQLSAVFEQYISRINNLPLIASTAPSTRSTSFVPLPPHVKNTIVNTTDLLGDLPLYYDESLFEIINHLHRYFDGAQPCALLIFLDYCIEPCSSNRSFLQSLRDKLLQKFGDSTGGIRISDETIIIDELLCDVPRYNGEIYRLIRDIMRHRWDVREMFRFVDNVIASSTEVQTRKFLQTIRERLVCMYLH